MPPEENEEGKLKKDFIEENNLSWVLKNGLKFRKLTLEKIEEKAYANIKNKHQKKKKVCV